MHRPTITFTCSEREQNRQTEKDSTVVISYIDFRPAPEKGRGSVSWLWQEGGREVLQSQAEHGLHWSPVDGAHEYGMTSYHFCF